MYIDDDDSPRLMKETQLSECSGAGGEEWRGETGEKKKKKRFMDKVANKRVQLWTIESVIKNPYFYPRAPAPPGSLPLHVVSVCFYFYIVRLPFFFISSSPSWKGKERHHEGILRFYKLQVWMGKIQRARRREEV